MKTLNESFEEAEYEKLREAKGSQTWHDWLLQKAEEDIGLMSKNGENNGS